MTDGPSVQDDLRDLAGIERDIQDLDAALRRIDDGTYGVCGSCHTPIDADVLAAAPLAGVCPVCISATG